MSSCAALSCGRNNDCCQITNGIAYCLVESQCKVDPLWQAIVIPAVLFLFAVILIIVVAVKLSRETKTLMKVNNFAKKQIRIQRLDTKLSNGRFQTFPTLQTLTSVV